MIKINNRVLIIDDEENIRITLSHFLKRAGYDVETVDNAKSALLLMENDHFDVIITDIVMPRISGMELLKRIHKKKYNTEVILITGEPNLETASAAVREGAFDYISKPVTREMITFAVQKAAQRKLLKDEKTQLELENLRYQEKLEQLVVERTKALRRNEDMLSKAQEIAHIGSWRWNMESNEMTWSQELFQIFEVEPDTYDPNHKSFLDFIHPKDIDFYTNYVSRAFLDEKAYELEYRIVPSEGRVKSIIERGIVTKTPNQDSMIITGTIQDITDQKAQSKKIMQLTQAIEQSPVSVVITDVSGNISYVNPAFSIITGYSKEEAIGQNPRILKSGNQPPEFYIQLWDTLLKGEDWKGQFHNKKKDGELFWESAHISQVKDEDGTVINYIAVKEDITQQKKADIELAESNSQTRELARHLQTIREEERIQISQEIHDELGQVITALKMDLFWLKGKISPDEKDILAKILDMTGLIDMTFDRLQKIITELRPSILDKLGLIEAINWLANEFQKRSDISCKLTINFEKTKFHPVLSTAIFRIIQESLTNVTRHSKASEVEIIMNLEDKNLVVEIIDNGKGVSADDIANIKSHGLVGMRERVMAIEGKFEISNMKVDGSGTRIAVACPINV